MNKNFYKCRLCMKLGDFSSIFEQDDSLKLSEMVMSFTNLKIYEHDGLSDRVCSSCIESLSTAYLFKIQCEENDGILRSSREKRFENYDDILNKELQIHSKYGVVHGNHDDAIVKDANLNRPVTKETSDETDSDLDSIKCVYCNHSYNSIGAHLCHVTCTIENKGSSTGSDETLIATDVNTDYFSANSTINHELHNCLVSCVLCDNKYNEFEAYVQHINICTSNVKLHYFVCPLCHEINTEREVYLQHLYKIHFTRTATVNDSGQDFVDAVDTIVKSTPQSKSARRQITYSFEDIYQEIDQNDMEEKSTPTSSPLKTFFAKLGNDTFSRNSSPRKVNFRKIIEDGKAKTSNYFPFKRYIKSYKQKKKEALYSPVVPKSKRVAQLKITHAMTDSDYGSPSSTSEDSWKLKQNLICACDKKVFMLSEHLEDRQRVVSMITKLGGVVAENTKMEMLATHFIAVLPNDTYTGMMVCALATGKWLLHVNYVYDSYRGMKYLHEKLYEWTKHPKILEVDNTSVELAKSASYWQHKLIQPNSKMPFEGLNVILIMKKKYRQYYQMVFKTLKAKPVAYDPRTPGSCCIADYCFVDMKVIERVKLNFFTAHNIPVLPYQYILVYLLNRGQVDDQHKYLLQDCPSIKSRDTVDLLNKTF